MVGSEEVPQQTPRAVTSATPWSVTLPPHLAVITGVASVVTAILLTALVVTVGNVCGVVNVTCSPYEVPPAFVAYART